MSFIGRVHFGQWGVSATVYLLAGRRTDPTSHRLHLVPALGIDTLNRVSFLQAKRSDGHSAY